VRSCFSLSICIKLIPTFYLSATYINTLLCGGLALGGFLFICSFIYFDNVEIFVIPCVSHAVYTNSVVTRCFVTYFFLGRIPHEVLPTRVVKFLLLGHFLFGQLMQLTVWRGREPRRGGSVLTRAWNGKVIVGKSEISL
jgi:hypothetical protein